MAPSSLASAPASKAFHRAAGQRFSPIVFQTIALRVGRRALELDDLAVARVVEAGERRGVRAGAAAPATAAATSEDGEPHGLTLHERPLQRSSFTSFAASFALIFA